MRRLNLLHLFLLTTALASLPGCGGSSESAATPAAVATATADAAPAATSMPTSAAVASPASADTPVSAAVSASALAAANPGFRNPLGNVADPYVQYYKDSYYLAETDANTGTVYVRKAASLGGLLGADRVAVYKATLAGGNRAMWAPSFVALNDHWYLYYTAGDGVDDQTHRMYAIESTATISSGARPDGTYVFKAKVADPANDVWAIDGLPFSVNGALFFVWSGMRGTVTNQLMIAPMSDPWTISGTRTYLPAAGGCADVREAPSILQRNARTFLIYSTCDTGTPDYQLWMLSLKDGLDPRVAANWVQAPAAVFSRNDSAGVYAPGSNNFFKSPDNTEDWIAYHAKNTSTYTYDGRTTRAQKIGWNADGTPNLGVPLAAGATQTVPSGDPGTGPVAINDTDTGALAAGTVAAPGGTCMEVRGSSSASGAAVQLATCNAASAAQQWTVAGDGTLRAFGKCLDIAGNSTKTQALMEIWDCNGVGGQQWIPQANGALLNPQSGLCLDDPAYNTAPGTQLQTWTCNNAAPQVYRLPVATMRVAYAGSWSAGSACGVQCFYGNDHYSGVAGATATYSVHGSRVVLLASKDPGDGIAAVSVDGAAEVMVDSYATIRSGEQVLWLSPRLFVGDHTIRVRVTGTKRAAATNTVIALDRMEVFP